MQMEKKIAAIIKHTTKNKPTNKQTPPIKKKQKKTLISFSFKW